VNPTTIETLIQLGLSIFSQVFSLFHKGGVPTSAAPAVAAHLNATPGMTADHVSVVNSAVTSAAKVMDTISDSTPVVPTVT
jgi:hypothetical protein